MRVKLDMTAGNKALRDPVMFRCNLTHHWRTGTEYKVGDWMVQSAGCSHCAWFQCSVTALTELYCQVPAARRFRHNPL